MHLTRWNPVNDFLRLGNEFDRLLDQGFRDFTPGLGGRFPSVDVFQTEKDVVIKAELPGVEIDDIDITATEESVTIKGESKMEKTVDEDGFIHRERRFGKFFRTIPLPVKVKSNETTANFKNGVLEIKLPKQEQFQNNGVKVKVNRLQ